MMVGSYVMVKLKFLTALIDLIESGLPTLKTLIAVVQDRAEFLLDALQLDGRRFTFALGRFVAPFRFRRRFATFGQFHLQFLWFTQVPVSISMKSYLKLLEKREGLTRTGKC